MLERFFRGAADCRWFCGLFCCIFLLIPSSSSLLLFFSFSLSFSSILLLFCCIYLVFCLFLAFASRPPSPSSSLHIFQLLPIFLPPYPHVLSIPLLQDTGWLELPCSSLYFLLKFSEKIRVKKWLFRKQNQEQ